MLPKQTLTITMAPGLIVMQKAGCAVVGTFINPAYTCNADASNNLIVINDFVTSTFTAGLTLTFTVDAITNPSNF